MVFPTIEFAAFFAVVFVVSWALMPHPSAWRPFILAASYFFYGWVDWRWVLLLMASSVSEHVRLAGDRAEPVGGDRKRALTAAIVFDLGLLCVFKYLGFFVTQMDDALDSVGLGSPLPLRSDRAADRHLVLHVPGHLVHGRRLPRARRAPASLIDVAILQAFFPHIVAGPIVRANELLPQLAHAARPARVLAGPASS